MRTRILLALLLQAPLFLLAQSNFVAGSVVTAKGDTLHGYVDYKQWRRSPAKISFKQQLNDADVQSFTPENATWFAVNGYESYAAFTVAISLNDINIQYLKEQADTATVTKTVFLKEVLKGDRVRLYSYTDELKERFFIEDKRQAVPQELLYRKTLKDMQEHTEALYQQQLVALAIQLNIFTTRLNQLIEAAPYSKERLSTVIGRMNATTEAGSTQVYDRKKRVDFFAGFGMNQNTVRYTGENLITINGVDGAGHNQYNSGVQSQAYEPRLAAGADVYLNPATRRLFIRTEVAAMQVKSSVQSYYKYSNYSDGKNEYTYQLNAWSYSFIPQVLYNVYFSTKLKWYVGAGASFNYLAVQENTMRIKDPTDYVTTQKDYFGLRTFSLNPVLTSGLLVKQRIHLGVIWGSPVDYADDARNISIKSGLLAVSVAYSLKK